MNSESLSAVQPELTSGESVLWASRPDSHVIFHKEDLFLIPFSFLWGGFAIFWELGVMGYWGTGSRSGWIFGMIWGIPFVLVGQYMIWGRFFYAAWKKRRTHYAVTNRRVIVVQNGWSRTVASSYIGSLPTLIKESRSNGGGTLRFIQAEPRWSGRRGWSAWDSMAMGTIPSFVDVDEVDYIYRLVSDLREKARTTKSPQ